MGRKNGKTALASAIELDLLINDDEGAPEVYNVATAHDQGDEGLQQRLANGDDIACAGKTRAKARERPLL